VVANHGKPNKQISTRNLSRAKASAELTEEQCGSSILREIRGAEQQADWDRPNWRWVALKIMSHVPNFHHFTVNLENLGFEGLSFQGRL
jgi:hypothetical protein